MAKADVEVLVVSWLNSVLTGDYANKAYGDKPKNAPAQYVVVDRTGGPRDFMVLDKAEILIEVYNKDSRATAKDVAYVLGDRIIELEAYNANITHAAINSIVNLDDTLAQYHRYQVYVDVWVSRAGQ
jgi:hypothetical protein